MNKAGVQCSGSGDCSVAPLSGRPSCKCNNGFQGYACQYNATALAERKVELRAEVNEAIKAAGDQKQELTLCRDEEKPFLCPDAGTCVATRKDCDVGGSKKATCKADKTKRWCGVSCISKKLRCPRTRACKNGRLRCADGSCKLKASKCPPTADTASLCDVAGEVPCGDGVTCAANAKACREAVQLDGCPIGLFSCPSNPKECRADKKDCRCAVAGEQFCGWQRTPEGRLLKEEVEGANGETALRKMPKCAAKCSGGAKNPLTVQLQAKPVAADPTNTTTTSLTTASDGDDASSTSLGEIKIGAGAVTSADDADAVVTFAIKPASLADVTEGSFKGRDVMSVAVTIVPDQVVIIDPEVGIEIELTIADDEAQTDPAKCAAVLKRLRPMSSQDLTADDSREVAGGCTKGKSSGCSCRFTTPHLATFAVVDAGIEVAGEPSA